MSNYNNTIKALRNICDECVGSETSRYVGDKTKFEARTLTPTATMAARYGTFNLAQVISERLAVVKTDAIDGAAWTWTELLPGKVMSRVDGAGSLYDCFYNPQGVKMKLTKKVQHTELLYIDREICMMHYIGSKFQGGQDGMPVFFSGSDSVHTITQSRVLVTNLFIVDFQSMAMAIDGNFFLGDFTGVRGLTEGKGSIINGKSSVYPNIDGVFKQQALHHNNAYFHAGTVTLPAVGDGFYCFRQNADLSNIFEGATAAADLVEAINELCWNIDGESIYTATLSGDVITIIANNQNADAYGPGMLQIYHTPNGDLSECETALPFEVIQHRMDCPEEPCLFDYGMKITSSSFTTYFVNVMKRYIKKLMRLYANGMAPTTDLYIAIDPLLLFDGECERFEKACGCQNLEEFFAQAGNILPRFVKVNALMGTGLWYMSTQSNNVILTNMAQPRMQQTKVFFDEQCDKIGSKNRMVFNALVLDQNLTASNILNSPFMKGLHPAMSPENIPALCPEVRSNCCDPSELKNNLRIEACYAENDDGTFTIELDAIHEFDDVTDIEWSVDTGLTISAQAESIDLTVTAEEFESIKTITVMTNGAYQVVPLSTVKECC